MPLFTASAQATDHDGQVEVMQLVVAAYDARHAIDLCCAALERHNQHTRRQRGLAYFRDGTGNLRRNCPDCACAPSPDFC